MDAMRSRTILIIAAMMMVTLLIGSAADGTPVDRDVPTRTRFSAVESLEVGLRQLGHDTNLMDLLRVFEASENTHTATTIEGRLIAVAREHGASAAPLSGFRGFELRLVPRPAILKIRPSVDADETDHFVLLQAIEGEEATVIARGHRTLRVPIEDITRLWNGEGVALSAEPLPDTVRSPSLAWMNIGYGAVAVLGVLAVTVGMIRWRRVPEPPRRLSRMLLESAAVVTVAILVGMSAWFSQSGQLINDARAAAFGSTDVFIDFRDEVEPLTINAVKELTTEELKRFIAEQDVLWIDARSQEEYDRDHVHGAICLPRFDGATVRLRLAGVATDQPMVVYCISRTCGRGRAAAGSLKKAGFLNVIHYPPGWIELKGWMQLRGRTEEPMSIKEHLATGAES